MIITNEMRNELGPLGILAGVWEGDKGDDTAPSDSRGTEKNSFRERLVLEPIGAVNNHEQRLYGLRYQTTAWPAGETAPFHEENGYWLWDEKNNQVMRCFIVPRGVTVLAGATVDRGATEFILVAEQGSPTYGICSNKFLDAEFKTLRYELKIKIIDENTFRYEEDTQLKIKGQDVVFHHRDSNTLKRMAG